MLSPSVTSIKNTLNEKTDKNVGQCFQYIRSALFTLIWNLFVVWTLINLGRSGFN